MSNTRGRFNPLKVWLYRGGFARFSNTRFSLDSIEDNLFTFCVIIKLTKAPTVKQLHGREKRVGGWDLLWDDGIVLTEEVTLETGMPTSCCFNSKLIPLGVRMTDDNSFGTCMPCLLPRERLEAHRPKTDGALLYSKCCWKLPDVFE